MWGITFWATLVINKYCLRQFILGVNSCVSYSFYLRFRCGCCTTSKVRSVHIPLNRQTCSTGLQHTAGTATYRFRTVGGCTMTNVSSRTPDLTKTMRPTRRRRQVAVLQYCYWLLDIARFCISRFVMPLGTQGTKLLFLFFRQFPCLYLSKNIAAIIKSTRKSVGLSHCQKCFQFSLN